MKQEEFEKKLEEFKDELTVVHQELKEQVLLTNQVKQRAVLERARMKISKMLGKPTLESGKSWKEYFHAFELEEWKAIFEEEKDVQKMEGVKRLLKFGSLQLNKNIHEFEYEEIYDSIFAVEIGKDQKSWVWLLAFIYSMTEEQITNT